MTAMRAVRSELMKFFSTRLWWGMALGIFAAGAAFSVLYAFLYTSEAMAEAMGAGAGTMPTGSPTQIANSVYTAGAQVGYLLLLTIGVMQVGAEYRHQTITGTFLATPHRGRAMLAKVGALLAIGSLYALISLIGSVAFGALTLDLRGADPFPALGVLRTLALTLLVLGLWALIGLGIGILIPNQVAALLIGVGVAWLVEPIVAYALAFWDFASRHLVPFFPSTATQGVLDLARTPEQHLLDWWAAALVLTAYAAALAGIGILRAQRQDVT